MTEYTPDEETVREQYTREEPPHFGTVSERRAEFDRFLARVRRDAAREALDGLARAMMDTPGIGPGTKTHRARMRVDVVTYRDRNYPEGTP